MSTGNGTTHAGRPAGHNILFQDEGGDWRNRARCRSYDPELWFPVGTTGPAEQQIQDAKAVCALCPVREACLEWALDTHQDHGIWGGMDESERRAIHGRRRRVRSA